MRENRENLRGSEDSVVLLCFLRAKKVVIIVGFKEIKKKATIQNNGGVIQDGGTTKSSHFLFPFFRFTTKRTKKVWNLVVSI
jgi:hypothetical protein